MPSTPYLINGTVENSSSLQVSNALITFTTSSGNKSVASNSIGRYVIDLANIGYTSGETASYSAVDEFLNESDLGTFAVTGGNRTLNITLSIINSAKQVKANTDTQLYNIGGKPISEDNPLPVTVINTVDLIDLTNNPNWEQTHDTNGRLTKERITIRDISYERTFTYTGNNFYWNTRSKWQKV